MKSFLRGILVAVAVLVSTQVMAQGYTLLSKQAPLRSSGDKIEVTAVFSYTCPYCDQLEPLLQRWSATLPADVEFYSLPAAFNKQWEHLARAHYIMDATNITDQAHLAMFNAVHRENTNVSSMRALENFFARFGVDKQQVENLYSSFGVESRLRQDIARVRAYGITGVPAVIVDGRYVIDARSAGGLDQISRVADQIIAEIRNTQR